MEARIPFGGFYESIWASEIDREEEQYLEHLTEEHDLDVSDISEFAWRHTIYSRAHTHVAEHFVPYFEHFINEGLGLSIKLTYNDMSSPREYNFETNKIYVELSYEDALILARRVGRNALRKAAKDMFTSRDGFISFYRNDPAEWGRLRGWDHNHLYCLFQAAVDLIDDEDYEFGIADDMSGAGDFSTAYDKALDINALHVEIGRMLTKKELEEDATSDEDRRYPTAWTDTQDYVLRYEALNKNVFNSHNFLGDL